MGVIDRGVGERRGGEREGEEERGVGMGNRMGIERKVGEGERDRDRESGGWRRVTRQRQRHSEID